MKKQLSADNGVSDLAREIPSAVSIDHSFIHQILGADKEDSSFLQSAKIIHCFNDAESNEADWNESFKIIIQGRFCIPRAYEGSVEKTFNPMFFNICYKQLASVLFGECLFRGIFNKLDRNWYGKANLGFTQYFKNRLIALDIMQVQGDFCKTLNTNNFSAQLAIRDIQWIGESASVNSYVNFSDESGIRSEGTVLLRFRINNGL